MEKSRQNHGGGGLQSSLYHFMNETHIKAFNAFRIPYTSFIYFSLISVLLYETANKRLPTLSKF